MATAILGFNRKRLKTEIVDQLPEEGKSGTIYFVPNNIEDEDNNKYDEYIWLKDTKEWELIGVSEIDLENYATKEALEFTNMALFQEPVININQITNNTGGEGDGTRWRVPYAVTKAFQWINEDPTRQQWYFRPGLKIIFRASDVKDNNGFTGPFITFQYSLIDFSEVNFCNDSNWVRVITEADLNYITASATTNGFLKASDWAEFNNKVNKSVTINGHPLSSNVVLTKSDIGLGNVDNTSDLNKPVSTATQNALNAKQDTLVSGTNIKTINGTSLLGSGDVTIDLSLYKLVTQLPTESIDLNKIYLVLSATQGTQNIYTEYIYVGDKWEELGQYKAAVDLTPYLKKEDSLHDATLTNYDYVICFGAGGGGAADAENIYYSAITFLPSNSGGWERSEQKVITFYPATQTRAGVLTAEDKTKLDGLKNYVLPTASSTALGGVKSSTTGTTAERDYSVEVNADGTMKVNVPWTNTTYSVATSSANGLMSSTDKSKLDNFGKVNKVSTTGAVTQEIQPNQFYEFGEVTSLTITLASQASGYIGEYQFQFTSGSTPATLNLPENVSYMVAPDFQIEANKTYQVSILNNVAVIGGY